MKSKDQRLLEEAYTRVVESHPHANPPPMFRNKHSLESVKQHDDRIKNDERNAGVEEDNVSSTDNTFKPREEGDVFYSRKHNKTYIVIKDKEGKLFPAEKIFTSKNGTTWERVKKKDGSWGVKPYVKPEPVQPESINIDLSGLKNKKINYTVWDYPSNVITIDGSPVGGEYNETKAKELIQLLQKASDDPETIKNPLVQSFLLGVKNHNQLDKLN